MATPCFQCLGQAPWRQPGHVSFSHPPHHVLSFLLSTHGVTSGLHCCRLPPGGACGNLPLTSCFHSCSLSIFRSSRSTPSKLQVLSGRSSAPVASHLMSLALCSCGLLLHSLFQPHWLPGCSLSRPSTLLPASGPLHMLVFLAWCILMEGMK